MNATEKLTSLWLMTRGYFVIERIRVGHNEIDLLAVKPDESREKLAERLHVEVQVSSTPAGAIDPESYVRKKFDEEKVKERVTALLGKNYSRWLVLGRMPKGKEEFEEISSAVTRGGVKVVPFEDVVRGYLEALQYRPAAELGDLLHLLRSYGFLSMSGHAQV